LPDNDKHAKKEKTDNKRKLDENTATENEPKKTKEAVVEEEKLVKDVV
jgi:hypothetical protein